MPRLPNIIIIHLAQKIETELSNYKSLEKIIKKNEVEIKKLKDKEETLDIKYQSNLHKQSIIRMRLSEILNNLESSEARNFYEMIKKTVSGIKLK